uniref:ATP synthase F(0) complex subunit e, mitochondrial n=2 Tax=Cyprinus carpio TaxID=7962 RepID=A0A8C2H221_CYPCA
MFNLWLYHHYETDFKYLFRKQKADGHEGYSVTASRAQRLPPLSAEEIRSKSNMVPPVQVSPLIKTARWSALLIGLIYGKQRYDYLKPIAAEERRIEEEEKKLREEQERIYKQLSEANSDTILK